MGEQQSLRCKLQCRLRLATLCMCSLGRTTLPSHKASPRASAAPLVGFAQHKPPPCALSDLCASFGLCKFISISMMLSSSNQARTSLRASHLQRSSTCAPRACF